MGASQSGGLALRFFIVLASEDYSQNYQMNNLLRQPTCLTRDRFISDAILNCKLSVDLISAVCAVLQWQESIAGRDKPQMAFPRGVEGAISSCYSLL